MPPIPAMPPTRSTLDKVLNPPDTIGLLPASELTEEIAFYMDKVVSTLQFPDAIKEPPTIEEILYEASEEVQMIFGLQSIHRKLDRNFAQLWGCNSRALVTLANAFKLHPGTLASKLMGIGCAIAGAWLEKQNHFKCL